MSAKHFAVSHDHGDLAVTACPVHEGRRNPDGTHSPRAFDWTTEWHDVTCRACLKWMRRHHPAGAPR